MPEATTVIGRIEQLRNRMREEGISFCLMTSSDPHGSEYVSDCFKVTEFFSGCTSDNVALLVGEHTANLWTDGRYFLSASKELNGTGIELMRAGEKDVPSVGEFLKSHLQSGMCLAYDGRCILSERGNVYRETAALCNCTVRGDFDPAEGIWTDRPQKPSNPVWVLENCEEPAMEKTERLRQAIRFRGASSMILSRLDDIMWITNLRGSDIPCNPVALSFCIVNADRTVLYLNSKACTKECEAYLEANHIERKDYEDFYPDLETAEFVESVFLCPSDTSDRIVEILLKRGIRPVAGENPIKLFKAVKTERELEQIRSCYLADSAALCSFLCEVEDGLGKEEWDEMALAKKLDDKRRTIPDFLDLSFPTISAFGENAAIIHYEPKPETNKRIEWDSFYLVDSGGQYQSGTTDVTRTIPTGEISPQMKKDYTLVAVANLRLLFAKFQHGTTGVNLDMFARAPLWEEGLDYRHGTGHGIGFVLNVHEGPQNISWRSRKGIVDTPFETGMITSIEPGIYRDGEYGIRTETIAECVFSEENEYGRFLAFSPLTYVPISKAALDPAYMEPSDIRKLNAYHEEVYKKISPLLKEDREKEWLYAATRPI